MDDLDPEDMLVEVMLKNHLSGKKPPDVSGRVLECVFPTPGQKFLRIIRSPHAQGIAALLALCAGIVIWMGSPRQPPAIAKTPVVKESNPQPPREKLQPHVAKTQSIFEDPPLADAPPAVAQPGVYHLMAGVISRADDRSIVVRSDFSGHEFQFGVSKGDTDAKEIATLFKRLAVGKQIVIRWRMDDPPLFNAVMFLEKKNLNAMPESGTSEGTVAGIGNRWIELKNGQGVVRYTPVWFGEAPEAGGHFDREISAKFQRLKMGDTVRVKWYQDLHRRAVSVERLNKPEKDIDF